MRDAGSGTAKKIAPSLSLMLPVCPTPHPSSRIPKDRHYRVAVPPALAVTRQHFGQPMLDAQRVRKRGLEPKLRELRCQARVIRWVGECYVVRVRGKPAREPHRLLAVDHRRLACIEACDVLAEEHEAPSRLLHEIDNGRAARERLETECTCAGEQVEHPRVR